MMQAIQQRYFAFLLLLTALGLQACASINPIAAAETPDQRAYAIFGTFTIFSEKAADLAENPTLPRNVRLGLVNAQEEARPVVNDMLEVLDEYETIKAQVEAGETGQDRFAIVARNLNSWVDRVVPLVNRLVSRVTEAD